MDRSHALKELARRCRALAAETSDEETRKSLELLARDYDVQADQAAAEIPKPDMPRPPEG
jgi:hypothetical protein